MGDLKKKLFRRGPKDQEMKRPGDQWTRGKRRPKGQGTNRLGDLLRITF